MEKKRIMSKVVGIIVRAMMRNHFYKWGDTIKQQEDGGSIGLHATGCISRVVMDKWIKLFSDTVLTKEHDASTNPLMNSMFDFSILSRPAINTVI